MSINRLAKRVAGFSLIELVSTRRFLATCVGLLLLLSQPVQAACSPYVGKLVFNEVQISGSVFAELRILDPTVVAATSQFSGWTISANRRAKSNGAITSTTVDLGALVVDPSKNTCGASSAWIQIPDASLGNILSTARNNSNDGVNLVLYDSNGNFVDILRAAESTFTSYYSGAGAQCSAVENTLTSAGNSRYDFNWGTGSSIKDWFRTSDGTGTWSGQSTANKANSICGSNDNDNPAQIGLNKVASSTVVNINTQFTYTLFASNPLSGLARSNVVVTDPLPPGVSFVSCTATAPDTCTHSAGTVTWTIGSLPTNTTRSAGLVVTATTTGSKLNTITANTSGPPTASATVTVDATAPVVLTAAATSVGTNTAVLNGSVNPNGSSTTVSFGSGVFTGDYRNTCTPTISTYPGSTTQAFSCNITGLVCSTTYYYRATGTNSLGVTASGTEFSFTTSSCGFVFDAYEASIDNTSAATLSNRIIKTRVASASNLCIGGNQSGTCGIRIAAFSTGAVATSYSGSVTAQLQFCTNVSRTGSGASSTVACGGSWANLGSSQSVALSNGLGTVIFSAINNAYEVVRVQITSSTVSSGPWNSTDNFAVRPASLSVSATNTSGVSLLGTGSRQRAGLAFNLSVDSAASLYRGTGAGPILKTTSNAAGAAVTATTVSGGTTGTLTIGTWTGTGTLISSTATYTEAGGVSVTLEDQDYANVDLNDGSTLAERYVSGTATLTRFTPAFFTTVVTQGCSVGAFTYSGQPFTSVVTARNYAGNTTLNYFGTAGAAQAVTLTDANSVAGLFTSASVLASAFTAGVATATPTYTFTSAATVPTAIKLRATDTDGVDSSTGNTGLAASAVEGASTIYSGRIRLFNANGSELLPLPITARVENYFASSGVNGWYTSTVDTSCSTLVAGNFAFSYPASSSTFTNNISACTTGVSSADFLGSPPTYLVKLKTPGTGKSGATDLSLNLGASASGSACTCTNALAATSCTSATATTANRSWLQFNWSGSTANPAARATFGISKSGPKIHLRELY